MTRIAIFCALVLVACHGDDECDRALARQARISASRHQPRLSEAGTDLFLDGCRDAKASRWDPVLRCLVSSPSDDDAAACIDRIMRDVVHGPAGAPAEPDGRGLNPLLDQ
jgi:hypothetical protein